jgi:ribosomal protein S6
MFLLDPADAANDWENLRQHVVQMIERLGGEILYSERWPDRKLAYDIKGRRKGTYFLVYMKLDGTQVAPLRREAQLSDRIIRALVLRQECLLGQIERYKEASTRSATPVLDVTASKRLADDDDMPMGGRGRRSAPVAAVGASQTAAVAAVVAPVVAELVGEELIDVEPPEKE